jgi:hypothetical protein
VYRCVLVFVGVLVYWCVLVCSVCWYVDVLVCWCVGVLMCWCVGLFSVLVCRCVGVLVCCCVGVFSVLVCSVCWCVSNSAKRSHDQKIERIFRTEALIRAGTT